MSTQLPESVQRIADVIGEAAALALVESLPRQSGRPGHPSGEPVLYVPQRMTPNHRIARIIGFEGGAKLCRHFGGEQFFLATCAARMKRDRDADIAGCKSPAQVEDAARRHGISLRHARRIRRRASADKTPMQAQA